jgi:hypothetical protein
LNMCASLSLALLLRSLETALSSLRYIEEPGFLL